MDHFPYKSNLLFWIELVTITLFILSFGWCTYERNTVWKDDLLLWSDVVKKSPDKARGYNEIGMYFYERQHPDKAIPFFMKALMLDPYLDTSHNNLGLCLLGTGHVDQAIEEFQKAIQINPLNGMHHINLGIAYWQKGLPELAHQEITIGKILKRKHTPKQPLHRQGLSEKR